MHIVPISYKHIFVYEAQAFIKLCGSCSTCAQMAVGRRIGNWRGLHCTLNHSAEEKKNEKIARAKV